MAAAKVESAELPNDADSEIQRSNHAIRLLAVILSVNVRPCASRAGVPEPFLCGLDPARLSIDQHCSRAPQNMGGR